MSAVLSPSSLGHIPILSSSFQARHHPVVCGLDNLAPGPDPTGYFCSGFGLETGPRKRLQIITSSFKFLKVLFLNYHLKVWSNYAPPASHAETVKLFLQNYLMIKNKTVK